MDEKILIQYINRDSKFIQGLPLLPLPPPSGPGLNVPQVNSCIIFRSLGLERKILFPLVEMSVMHLERRPLMEKLVFVSLGQDQPVLCVEHL